MANRIIVNLDTSKNQYNIFECKQNDDLVLEANIFENGIEKDLTNSTIVINCTRSNDTYCIQNTGITKEGSKIIANLDREFTKIDGLDKLEIVLTEEGNQNTTFDFNILVKPSVIKGAVESYNTVTVLEELDNKVLEAIQVREETELLIINGGAATKEEVKTINSSLEQIEKMTNINLPFWEVPTQPNTWATTPSGKDLNINSEQFMDLFFNPYVDKTYDDGYKVTKTLLGKDQSDTYNIYEYIFEPKNYTRTIIITSGNHPYELPAHFGFGRFIHYIMNEPDIHEGIRYIRDNVRIVTIPVINPWGFSQSPKVYGNCNLVNINRNFDVDGRWDLFPTGVGNEWNYKGTKPFSEKETQILRDFYIKYSDIAEFAIDCHCGINNPACDLWIVGLSRDSYILDKINELVPTLDKRLTSTLNRQPINKFQLDMDSSIRCWYSSVALGLPNISVEYLPQRYGGQMNGSEDLTWYLLYLSNIIFSVLSYSNERIVGENNKRLSNKINLLNNGLDKNNKEVSNINNVMNVLSDYVLYGAKNYINVDGETITQTTSKNGLLLNLNVIGKTTNANNGSNSLNYTCEESSLLLKVNENEYNIELQRPLRSSSSLNYDEIKDGKYIKRCTRDIIRNASNVISSNLSNTYWFSTSLYGSANSNEEILCNCLPTTNNSLSQDIEGIRMSTSNGAIGFRVLKTKVDSVGGIEKWLEINNFEVVYKTDIIEEDLYMPTIFVPKGNVIITTNNTNKPLIKCSISS